MVFLDVETKLICEYRFPCWLFFLLRFFIMLFYLFYYFAKNRPGPSPRSATVKYRSGRSNRNADALRRKLVHGQEPLHDRLEEVVAVLKAATLSDGSTFVPECIQVCIEETTIQAQDMAISRLLYYQKTRSPSSMIEGALPCEKSPFDRKINIYIMSRN